MKLAMLGWEFPPFLAGGLGIHCLELTTHLAGRGVDIDFYMPHMPLTFGAARVAEHHRHLRIHEVEADPGAGPYSSRRGYDAKFNAAVKLYNERVVQAFRNRDADVLHAHDWITMPAALELGQRYGIPTVVTFHSLEYDRSAGFYPQAWIEDIERRAVHTADHVIAVSRYTKQELVERYAADPGRITPIHNGVAWQKLGDAPPRPHRGRGRRILFLSRVSRQKGPLYFMDTARRVLEAERHASATVVGTGEMLPECIHYALDHGVADRVSFAGYVPDDERPLFYRGSDVYLLPSVSEPFGISILEAMACGVPSIVSRTTGAAEALNHVVRVPYWDTEDASDLAVRLLREPSMREEMARNGLRESHRFTWDRTAERTLDVYRALVHTRRPLEVLA